MTNIDLYKVLGYGAIGLSCILAIAAYFLLRKEQDKERPRKQILTSVYVFMAFSLVLAILSFYRDSIKDKNAEKLKSARQIVRVLLDQKGGKIRQLSELSIQDSTYYYKALKNLTADLRSLDSAMTEIIKDEEGQ